MHNPHMDENNLYMFTPSTFNERTCVEESHDFLTEKGDKPILFYGSETKLWDIEDNAQLFIEGLNDSQFSDEEGEYSETDDYTDGCTYLSKITGVKIPSNTDFLENSYKDVEEIEKVIFPALDNWCGK